MDYFHLALMLHHRLEILVQMVVLEDLLVECSYLVAQQVLAQPPLTLQDLHQVRPLIQLPIYDQSCYRYPNLNLFSWELPSLQQPSLLASSLRLHRQQALHSGMPQSNVALPAVRLLMKRSLRTRPSLLT
jgi:hypothetical protein